MVIHMPDPMPVLVPLGTMAMVPIVVDWVEPMAVPVRPTHAITMVVPVVDLPVNGIVITRTVVTVGALSPMAEPVVQLGLMVIQQLADSVAEEVVDMELAAAVAIPVVAAVQIVEAVPAMVAVADPTIVALIRPILPVTTKIMVR